MSQPSCQRETYVEPVSSTRCWPGTDRWRMLSPNGHLLPAMLNVKQIADNLQIEIRYFKKFWKCSTISYLWEEHGRCTLLYWEIGMEARPTRNEKTAPKFSTQKNKKWRGIEGKGFYDTIVRRSLKFMIHTHSSMRNCSIRRILIHFLHDFEKGVAFIGQPVLSLYCKMSALKSV